jgi:ribose 5-phosphate isomerase A
LGIPLSDLESVSRLDLAVDGADEIDGDLNLIKGAGAALLREKLVEILADRLVIIADGSKLVSGLGQKFAVPVEVVPFGWKTTATRLRALSCEPVLRMKGDAPLVTDNGNYILDCRFKEIPSPSSTASALKAIPGVVEHGIFANMAESAIVAMDDGKVLVRNRDQTSGKMVDNFSQ